MFANYNICFDFLCNFEVTFVYTITRQSMRELCTVKFRKPACDVLATHVHLILSTQSRYSNTYYVSTYVCVQVNYRIKNFFLLSYANQITIKSMNTHV